jgi:hypothetical protein
LALHCLAFAEYLCYTTNGARTDPGSVLQEFRRIRDFIVAIAKDCFCDSGVGRLGQLVAALYQDQCEADKEEHAFVWSCGF